MCECKRKKDKQKDINIKYLKNMVRQKIEIQGGKRKSCQSQLMAGECMSVSAGNHPFSIH